MATGGSVTVLCALVLIDSIRGVFMSVIHPTVLSVNGVGLVMGKQSVVEGIPVQSFLG